MKRALDDVVEALKNFPGTTVDLLVGEPCFGPPVEVGRAFEGIAAEPAWGYGPPGGLDELRRVLADRESRNTLGPQNIVVTHGAKGGLLALFATLVGPGDEVIHPLPCYPAYPAMVRRFGGVPIGVAEHGRGFSGLAEEVSAAMGPRTRAVVLASPSNPTGTTITGEDMDALIAACRGSGVRLILDEAYSAFCYDGTPVGSSSGHLENTLVRIGSASKGLALCGWRIGWIVADGDLVKRIVGVQSALLNPPATPPQRALLALPEVPESYFHDNRLVVRERLEAMVESLRRAGFDAAMPAGGFYLWVDIRDRLQDRSSAEWCERLAATHGIGLWPGEDFGTPGHVRLALPQGPDWREDVRELERRMTVVVGLRR